VAATFSAIRFHKRHAVLIESMKHGIGSVLNRYYKPVAEFINPDFIPQSGIYVFGYCFTLVARHTMGCSQRGFNDL
jgi:hypothetical protein